MTEAQEALTSLIKYGLQTLSCFLFVSLLPKITL